MKRIIAHIDLDLAGFTAATLCFIHCSILPILLGMGILSGLSWVDSHVVEYIFIFSGILFAAGSLLQSYYAKHRNALPLLIAVAGFILFYFGFMSHEHGHIGLTSLAGLCLASAHAYNFRLLKKV